MGTFQSSPVLEDDQDHWHDLCLCMCPRGISKFFARFWPNREGGGGGEEETVSTQRRRSIQKHSKGINDQPTDIDVVDKLHTKDSVSTHDVTCHVGTGPIITSLYPENVYEDTEDDADNRIIRLQRGKRISGSKRRSFDGVQTVDDVSELILHCKEQNQREDENDKNCINKI
jgi:hypothetical protein